MHRNAFKVSLANRPTGVRRYPISVVWPPAAAIMQKPVVKCRSMICERYQLPSDVKLGVGIKRLDYTKGIVERLRGETAARVQPGADWPLHLCASRDSAYFSTDA